MALRACSYLISYFALGCFADLTVFISRTGLRIEWEDARQSRTQRHLPRGKFRADYPGASDKVPAGYPLAMSISASSRSYVGVHILAFVSSPALSLIMNGSCQSPVTRQALSFRARDLWPPRGPRTHAFSLEPPLVSRALYVSGDH